MLILISPRHFPLLSAWTYDICPLECLVWTTVSTQVRHTLQQRQDTMEKISDRLVIGLTRVQLNLATTAGEMSLLFAVPLSPSLPSRVSEKSWNMNLQLLLGDAVISTSFQPLHLISAEPLNPACISFRPFFWDHGSPLPSTTVRIWGAQEHGKIH